MQRADIYFLKLTPTERLFLLADQDGIADADKPWPAKQVQNLRAKLTDICTPQEPEVPDPEPEAPDIRSVRVATPEERFEAFCLFFGCQPTDDIRAAWQRVEARESKLSDAKLKRYEIDEIIPQILHSAALERSWRGKHGRENVGALHWLDDERYLHPEYGVALGALPPDAEGENEKALREARAIVEEIQQLGGMVQPIGYDEPPVQALRRVQAKLRQVKRDRQLGLG